MRSRGRKLTREQVQGVRQIVARRRELEVELNQLPTLEQIAEECGVSVQALRKVIMGESYSEIV